MDTLSFISSLVSSLAWPIAAIGLGLVFRAPISNVLMTAKRLKGLGVEVERELEALQIEAAQLPAPSRDAPSHDPLSSAKSSELQDQVRAIADIAPVAAISFAWSQLEIALRGARSRLLAEGKDVKKQFAAAHINALQESGHFDTHIAGLLHRLREVRNRVLHADPMRAVTRDEAIIFGEIAADMTDHLDEL